MKLTISSLYCEPGVKFSISHKVGNLLREKLIEKIMIPYNLIEKDQDKFLGLIVSTSSKTKEVDVKGPDYDKKNNFVNWGLWLPYREIKEAQDQLIPFLKYFFDAVAILFKKYNVKEEDIRQVQKSIEEEVINNQKYKYEKKEIPVPDLSDLGF